MSAEQDRGIPPSATIVPTIEGFDGDLASLTERLRRHPEEVRGLSVLRLVQTMVERWNAKSDPVASSDEVPATAWVVRRKIEMALPRPVASELAEVIEEQAQPSRSWLAPAMAQLEGLRRQANMLHLREPSAWPERLRPVSGRPIASLPEAWPRLKSKRIPAPTKIYREDDPIADRMQRWRHWLEHEAAVSFPSAQMGRIEVVSMFIALILLWSAGEVNVEQAQVYAPLEVVLGGQGE